MSHDTDPLFVTIHDLVTRILDGTATATDREGLEVLVGRSPEARSLYVAYMQETAILKWQHGLPAAEESVVLADGRPLSTGGGGFLERWRTGIAVATVAAIGLVTFFVRPRHREIPAPAAAIAAHPTDEASQTDHAITPASAATLSSQPPAAKIGVATLTRTSSVTWSNPLDKREDLTRLGCGDVLRFERGELELVFDAGVEVLVRGPAEVEVRTADYAIARLGTISARVGEDGRGFTIETPAARVIDLGTEFGLDVSPTGATEVAVFRGIVDLSVRRNDPPRRLRQGEALRVAADGSFDRVVAITSDRFPESIPRTLQAEQASPLITSVHDDNGDAGSRKFYRIVRGGLREDAQAFVDRNHQWNGVTAAGLPDFLQGLDYVMPYNDDKFANQLHVSVALAKPAVLYVLYSDSLPVAEWLRREFVDTGADVGLDEARNRFIPTRRTEVGPGASVDTVFSVWKREVTAPTTVTLGAVEVPAGREGYNMYGIAAAPLLPSAGAIQRDGHP